MGKTTIEWTDYSWNPVTGCTPISEGCRNCYARRIAHRLSQNPAVPHRERHEGFRVSCWPERLEEPLRWRKPRTVFVCSMGDIFHSNVPTDFIDKVLEIIAACPQHTFLMLTKRPENIEDKLYGGKGARVLGGGDYLPNLGLGVTVENQDAVKRILHLLKIPAAMRFVSVEPMLEPVKLGLAKGLPGLDWVICGEESGPNARHVGDGPIRDLKNQCVAAGVPFMLKQMWIGGKLVKMPELDGRVWDQRPEVSP